MWSEVADAQVNLAAPLVIEPTHQAVQGWRTGFGARR